MMSTPSLAFVQPSYCRYVEGLYAAGYSCAEAKAAGYTCPEATAAGFTLAEMKEV